MRYPVLQPKPISGVSADSDSWLVRVLDNFQQLLSPKRLSPAGSSIVPFGMLPGDFSSGTGRAQSYSLLTHAAILGALALLALTPQRVPNELHKTEFNPRGEIVSIPRSDEVSHRQASLGKRSGGGEEEQNPATRGELATRAPFQFAPPRLPHDSRFPVPATILDADAPRNTVPVTDLGLPWMNAPTNSAAPGRHVGIGTGPDGGMGDNSGDEGGNRMNAVRMRQCFRHQPAGIARIQRIRK